MEKKLLCILLLLGIALTHGAAQNPLSAPHTLKGWAERLDVQSRMLPQEVTFVHMDNTCYFQGDTIFYKAYVVRSDNGRPSDLSRVLYAELLDNDGYLIERQIIHLENGQGWGAFCLSDTLYCGYYELRAYTRWQLNWGGYEHGHGKSTTSWFYDQSMEKEYFRDYEKLYSRVFPVYKKPVEQGVFAHDMLLRPLRRYFRTKDRQPTAQVTFYPEGGEWVAGVPQRIAFEARDGEGRHLEGKLRIKNDELRMKDDMGEEVTEVGTEHRGRGSFMVEAKDGVQYEALFTWGEGNSQRVKLPKVASQGVVLSVSQTADSLRLSVQTRGLPLTDTLGLTILSNGILRHFEEITNEDIALPLDSLPVGIAQITIYNQDGRVWADRMVFVRHKDLRPQTVLFEHSQSDYAPYEQIELEVLLANGEGQKANGEGLKSLALSPLPLATISLAVRDKALSPTTNDDGTLFTELLLSSQIRGFVEQPGYYFERDDEPHRRALDLLLMVQGWRRYRWHDLTHTFTLTHPMEKQRILTGSVHNVSLPPRKPYDPGGIDRTQWYSLQEHFLDPAPTTPYGTSGPITKEGQRHYFHYEPYVSEKVDEGPEQSSANGDGFRMRSNQTELKPKNGLKREVLVHAEFIQGQRDMVRGEVTTTEGRFTIPLPDFHGYCLMHVAASDSTRWAKRFRKGKKAKTAETYPWIAQQDANNVKNLPEYYVRLSLPYPRFVRPYDFYQTAEAPLDDGLHPLPADSGVTMREITVRNRRGGLRHLDRTKPAFKLDAYQAFNTAVDAGMHLPVYYDCEQLMLAIAACYIGDMGNQHRNYLMEPRWNYGNETRTMYAPERFRARQLTCLDSVYVFTDYSPRKEGDRRYLQTDQPSVSIDLHLMPEGQKRVAYRDRFYLLPGYNVCEDFYQPRYQTPPLPDAPKDYRRTLYWNPDLQLDAEGRATVTFWNNCRQNQLSITAEGITPDGKVLTGRE